MPAGANAVVTAIVDGDTIDVDVGDREERVRLIGIDTPEIAHPAFGDRPPNDAECFGDEAQRYTGELLAVGSGVRLERDVVARDDYGRLLAYVYRAADGAFVNYEIVRHGFAQPLTIAPNTTFAELFVDAARSAEQRRRRALGCVRWPVAADRSVCHSVGVLDLRHRFPAVTEGNYQGWARFDGPAGTQVVDSAIEATAAWQRSGNNANSHGQFAAAEACDALVADVQGTLGRLLGADPGGFVFGPSTTANVFSLSRAIGRDLRPGDEIICTRLDHDSNVSPWLQVADDTGADVRLVEFDVDAGRLPVDCDRRRADRSHALGRRHRRIERDRHDARHHRHHRRRPCRRAPRS